MDIVAVLLIFSSGGAWLCARHRAAVPAVVFAVMATLLFTGTPLGSWMPGMVSSASHSVAQVGGSLAGVGGVR